MSSELIKFTGKDVITKTKQNNLTALAQKLGITYTHNGGRVCLAIDCSYSMLGKKLEQAKKGAKEFVNDAITIKGYQVSLIKFSTNAKLLSEATNNISVLEAHIDKLQVDDSTRMSLAINLANNYLKSNGGNLAIVVATDGVPEGRDETLETALAAATNAKQNGIDIIAIGTDDANQDFLSKLTSRTELAVHVPILQFDKAIASAVKLLPAN